MDQIRVPAPVFAGLEAIRQSGATNMFDYAAVLRLASMLNHPDTAEWLRDHKQEYVQGIMVGFESEG